MRILFLFLLLPSFVWGQVTDASQTTSINNTIRNITTPGGITKGNVSDRLQDLVNSKMSRAEVVTASGTDNYSATGNSSLALTQNFTVLVKFTNANTGASTLNINGLGAKDIRKEVTTALASGDIDAGQIYMLVYDGTNFQMLGAAGGGGGSPGGSDTQVQFNDGGSFGGDAGFVFNKTTNIATLGGLNISGLTASELVATDGSKNLQSLAVATYPSLTELSYVKGVTSSVQTQLGTKWSLTSGGTLTGNNTITMGANTLTFTGNRVTFTPNATVSGINIGSISSDPSSLVTADLWHNGTTGQLKYRQSGTTFVLQASLGSLTSTRIPFVGLSGGVPVLVDDGNFIYSTSTRTLTVAGRIVTLQQALASSWAPALSVTPGAHTSMTASTEFIANDFVGANWTWAAGTIATQRFNYFRAFTVTTGLATNAYTLYADAPTGNITNAWALGLNGNQNVIGNILVGTTYPTTVGGYNYYGSSNGLLNSFSGKNGSAGAAARVAYSLYNNSDRSLSLTMYGASHSTLPNNAYINTSANDVPLTIGTNGSPRIVLGGTGQITFMDVTGSIGTWVTFTQGARTGGVPGGILFTGGVHNGINASETHDLNFNLNRTVTFTGSTGFATQRAFRIQAPTYAFASATGTINFAATFTVDGAPTAGANAALTYSTGLYIPTNALSGVTYGYGLSVVAPTGATNNFAGAFEGGVTVFAPSTTGYASIRLEHGAAPTSPVDGDMWTTTAGLYVRINGVTVGPLN